MLVLTNRSRVEEIFLLGGVAGSRSVVPTVIAAVIAMSGLLVGASRAEAGVYQYCGVSINAGSWCGRNDIDRYYGYNEATRPSGTAVYVCQRTLFANTPSEHQRTCNYGATSRTFAQAYLLEAEVTHFSNGSFIVFGTAFD